MPWLIACLSEGHKPSTCDAIAVENPRSNCELTEAACPAEDGGRRSGVPWPAANPYFERSHLRAVRSVDAADGMHRHQADARACRNAGGQEVTDCAEREERGVVIAVGGARRPPEASVMS